MMTNLGFTPNGRGLIPGIDPADPNRNYMGYDPAGVYGDPSAAAPYASGYSTYGGDEDPMAITPEAAPAGPEFDKAKKKSKWGKKKLAGMLAAGAGLGAMPEPIEHYRFKTPGLLSGRM